MEIEMFSMGGWWALSHPVENMWERPLFFVLEKVVGL